MLQLQHEKHNFPLSITDNWDILYSMLFNNINNCVQFINETQIDLLKPILWNWIFLAVHFLFQ